MDAASGKGQDHTLMRKIITYIFIKIIPLIVFCGAIFSPTTLFYGEDNQIFKKTSPDKIYLLVVYKAKPFTLYSFYKMLIGEDYFFTVYDRCGSIIFKPSIFYGADKSVIYGGFKFSLHEKNKLFYPTNNGIESIKLKNSLAICRIPKP